MNATLRGFLIVTYEFIITLVVLLGGGFSIVFGHVDAATSATITGFVGLVLGFWFTKRSSERNGGKDNDNGGNANGT